MGVEKLAEAYELMSKMINRQIINQIKKAKASETQ